MKKTIGKMDMRIRILLGIVIASFGLYFQSWWGLIAIIPLVTALVGVCPLYSIFGINTCETPLKSNSK